MLDLTFLLGGVRAGKSARALELARRNAARGVMFVATAQALDDEMARRIALHKAERPPGWETLEAPLDLVSDVEQRLSSDPRRFGVVVIDCLTLWVSNMLLELSDGDDAEGILGTQAAELVAMMGRHTRVGGPDEPPRTWVVVGNEVGLGVVPPTSLGRRYRDALGRVNRIVAAAASDVTLMVAGLEVPLKTR